MPFKSEKQRKWMHANEPEMAKKWEKKEKKMKRVKELIKKMVREELAEMNEVRIPFSSSHIKQLKRAFKDMKGTLPDNNPLVQKIVQLLKGQDKKVLQQLANADIKYLSDKAKDILGEEKITEEIEPIGGMAKIAKIVKDKQHAKVGGQTVDMQSANLLMKLYNAVKDKDKEKMNKMSEKKLIMVLNKLWSRVKLKLPV